MKYFTNCKTLEELRKEYRTLLKKYHPDNAGGFEEATKEINNEYEKLFDTLKNQDTKENEWKYDINKDDLFKAALNAIINLNVTIEIIGCWIWVTGETYAVKDILKAAGFKWCSNKKAWSWHAGERYYKKSKNKLSMNDLRNLYGSENIKNQTDNDKLTA